MERKTIRKFAGVIIVAAALLTAMAFNVFAAPAAEDTITKAMQSIGVEDGTANGFYAWALGVIADSLGTMDKAMTEAGYEHDLAGIFDAAVNNTFDRFSGVESDEDALNIFEQIINEVN